MKDHANKVDHPANAKEAAGYDPQDTDDQSLGVKGCDAVKTAVDEADEDRQQHLNDQRQIIQNLSDFH